MDWLLSSHGVVTVSLFLVAGGYFTLYRRVRIPSDSIRLGHLRTLAWLVFRIYHRLKIDAQTHGAEPLPKEGAAIVVANHRSGIDPVALSLLSRRHVHFLVAREYYDTPGLRWLFRSLDCIPVNRDGNDWGALKAALKYLKAGRVIGIFPQGGIRLPEEGMVEGKAGVALLAVKTKTPLYPFFIDGSPHYDSMLRCFFTPSRTRITCGEPFRLNPSREHKLSRAEQEELTQQVLDSIAKTRVSYETDPVTSRRSPA